MADEQLSDLPRTGPRRRTAVVGAVLVVGVLAAVVAVAVRSRTDDGPGDAAARTPCAEGVDLLAVEAETGQRDDDLFDGFTSIGTVRTDDPEVAWLNEPQQVMTQPSFSPSGDRVAVRWADGDYESSGPTSESIWVVDQADGNARPLTVGTNDHSPAWSPDGDEIAFVRWSPDGQGTIIATVPSVGGPVRAVADLPAEPWSTELLWTPAGALLAWTWDDAANETVVRRVDPDGSVEEIGRVDGRGWAGLITERGDELLLVVWPEPASQEVGRIALDLTDGTTRPIDGPSGQLAASADGERLYLLDEDGEVHRAAYDGDAVTTSGTVEVGVEHGHGLAVGACTEGDPPQAAPDRPVIGTDWRLGHRRVAVVQDPPVDGCEEPACSPIRIALTEDAERPEEPAQPCIVWTGTLRGETVAVDDVAIGTGDRCEWFREWDTSPVGLRVEGDLLRFDLGQPRSAEPYTTTYGAWYAGEAPDPGAADLPSSDQLDEFQATTTTTAPPPDADCAQIDAFAQRLGVSTAVLGEPDGSTPATLAGSATVVVRGALVDGGLVSDVEAPAEAGLTYELVVEEVLAGSADDVAPGAVVQVILPFRYGDDDGRLPPALGQLGNLGGTSVLGAIPAIAFLTDEGATWPGDLLVHGRQGLAVACAGAAPGGLVGTGDAWVAADLDALAALVRSG